MKDEENEKTVQGRFRKGKDIPSGIHTTGRSLWQNEGNARSLSVPGGEPVLPHVGGGNRLLKQNLAKAPPGRAPTARGHPPSGETSACDGKGKYELKKNNNTAGTVSGQPLIPIENELFNTYKKTKQYKLLNFTIMKKQFLFLMVFVLAVFAGINKSYGQINSDPNVSLPPTCGGTSTNPSVGVSYPYTVAASGPGYAGTGTYTWKVTDNVDLLAASTVSGAAYYTATPSGATCNIVWGPSSVGNTYYVVVDYSEANTSGGSCTINNVKVFEVQPMNGFWLKINASTDGTVGAIIANNGSDKINICSPDVSRAEITKTGDPATAEVTYEYGVTHLFASIHAGGYQGDFQATLTVAGLTANQSLALPAGWTVGTVDGLGNGTYTQTLTIADAVAGADYPVALDITNNQFEGKTDLPVTITIDGTYDSASQKDKYDSSSQTCVDQPDDADYVIQTIKARPTVTPTTPASFVTENPALH